MTRMKKFSHVTDTWKCATCGREFGINLKNEAKMHSQHMKWLKPGMFVTDASTIHICKIMNINRKTCKILVNDFSLGFNYHKYPEEVWPIQHADCVILDNTLTQEIKEHQEEWQRRKTAINQANVDAAKK